MLLFLCIFLLLFTFVIRIVSGFYLFLYCIIFVNGRNFDHIKKSCSLRYSCASNLVYNCASHGVCSCVGFFLFY